MERPSWHILTTSSIFNMRNYHPLLTSKCFDDHLRCQNPPALKVLRVCWFAKDQSKREVGFTHLLLLPYFFWSKIRFKPTPGPNICSQSRFAINLACNPVWYPQGQFLKCCLEAIAQVALLWNDLAKATIDTFNPWAWSCVGSYIEHLGTKILLYTILTILWYFMDMQKHFNRGN